jgi:hypothetical protein
MWDSSKGQSGGQYRPEYNGQSAIACGGACAPQQPCESGIMQV